MTVAFRIRAWPRAAATGAAVAIFLAGGNNGAPHHDGANHYQAGIVADPRFEAVVSFTDEGWGAKVVPLAGAIGWAPSDPAKLDPMAALYWKDASIEIDRIKDGVTTRRLTGTVAEATVVEGKLVITCADLSQKLDKPFTTATFAGTGGIEGGESATGRAKRRSFGLVWNVEGRLLDKVNNIYEFGDPAFPLQGCTALRDMGRAGPLGIIAWQGSIAATLNALKAATPQRGGGLFAPSIACAKWWTQPAGPLTADLQGEASGYGQTPAGVAAQLLAAAGGPAISDTGPNRTAPVGIHIGDNNETTAAALDRLLQRIALGWRLNTAGTVEIWDYRFTAPVESLRATFISRESTIQPVKSRTVGYKKNERVHGEGEISAAVQASDVVYANGTTGEEMKPSEPGATKGALPAERDQIAQLELDTAAAETNIAAAQAQIAAIQSSVSADVAELVDQIGTININAAVLAAEVGVVSGDLDDLAAQAGVVVADLNVLEAQVGTVSGNLSSLQSEVGLISVDVGSLEALAATQGGQIATLQSTVSTQGSTISSQGTAISTLQANLATLTTTVSASSNPNVMLNGGFENQLQGWSGSGSAGAPMSGWFQAINANWGTYAANNAAWTGTSTLQYSTLNSDLLTGFDVGATFTVAGDADVRASQTGAQAWIQFIWSTSGGSVYVDGGHRAVGTGFGFDPAGGSRAIFKGSSVVPANVTGLRISLVVYAPVGVTVTGTAWRQIKLERGTVATPYSGEASARQIFTAYATLNSSFASLSSTVSTQGASISTLQSTTTTQGGSIATLQSQMVTANANIGTNATAISTANGNIASLTTRVSSAESSISTNATALTNLTGRTATLETTVSAQGASISTLQSTTSTQGGQIATLQSTVSTQGSTISSQGTAISTLQTNLATLTTTVAASSNPNVLPNGGFENQLQGWSGSGSAGAPTSGWFQAINANWGVYAANNSAWTGTSSLRYSTLNSDLLTGIDPGATFTVTGDADIRANQTGAEAWIQIIWATSSGSVYSDGGHRAVGTGFGFDLSGASRAIFKGTYSAPAGATAMRISLVTSAPDGVTVTSTAWRQIKLERGAVATHYSGEASARQVFTAYSALNGSFASLSSTVSTQGASISTLQSTTTTQGGSIATLQSQMVTANANIGTNATAISTANSNIASLTTRVSSAESSISTNATALTNLTGRTATLETTVTSQGGSISTLQNTTSTTSANVATLTTRVNASAPNILKEGSFANGLTGWSTSGGAWAVTGGNDPNWGRYVSVTGSVNSYASTAVQGAQTSATYTISADIDRGAATGGLVAARIIWANNGAFHSVGPSAIKSSGNFSNSEADRVWAAGACPSGANGFYVQLVVEGAPSGSNAFRRVKVNTGSAPARYSEEASIVQSFETLSTLTTQYASLQSTVSTQGVTIGTHASAITTLNGNVTTLFGQYGVEIDVGGYVTGFKLNSNGARGDMLVHVDRFAVGAPGSSSAYPFQVIGGTTYIKTAMIQDAAITTAKIGDLSVDTLKIANNAVTVPVGAYTAAEMGFSSGVWTAVQSASIISSGGPISVVTNFTQKQIRTGSTVRPNNQVRIVRNGAVIFGPATLYGNGNTTNVSSMQIPFSALDQPSAGSWTYELQVYRDDGQLDISHRSIILMELKK